MCRPLPALLLLVLLLAGCTTTPGSREPAAPVSPAATPASDKPGAATAPADPAVRTGQTLPQPPSPPVAPAPPVPLTPPTSSPEAPAVPPAKPATLIGSEESSAMFDNFTAFVTAVDGQVLPAGRAGWNTPLTVAAGQHRLKVAFNRGVFQAEAELPLNARPARAYQLKFASDAEVLGNNTYCEFWIVDTLTGESVTARRRVALSRVAPAK